MLNDEQFAAVAAMSQFLLDDEEFFVLSGAAGTGKTYCLRQLIEDVKGKLVFTAPTNKATKVLRDTLTTPEYKPECRTIYSLLGLRMEANGEVKELTAPEDPLDLTSFTAVIVDEGSMINSQLMEYIELAAGQGVKFIFMGDRAQLPPVGERESPIWKLDNGATLRKVMRHDNQILALATRIRENLYHPAPSIKFKNDNAGGEGVWELTEHGFAKRIYNLAVAGRFCSGQDAKAIAWRNVTVDKWNTLIRSAIFENAAEQHWLPSDRLILLEPAKLGKDILGTTDDEGRVESVQIRRHPIYEQFKCFLVQLTWDDNRTGELWLLHPEDRIAWLREKASRAGEARRNRYYWPKFWAFVEAFHQARHGYAITAHRSQGSTYVAACVNWRDVLLNWDRFEGFRCLYVGCTRPKRELYLG